MNVDLITPTFKRTPEPLPRRCGLCQSRNTVTHQGHKRPFCFVKGWTQDNRCCEHFEMTWEGRAQ